MNKFFPRTLIAAALALPGLAYSQAVPITFDMNGGLPGQSFTVDLLDWTPGNALAIGAISPDPGKSFQLLYQANLGLVSLGGVTQATAGLGGAQTFTAVAGFKEIVTSNTTGLNPVFAFNDVPVLSATNFFYIYANAVGSNLSGLGFAAAPGSVLVLSGHVTNVLSSNFTVTALVPGCIVACAPLTATRFDNFGANDYLGISTIVGSGTTDINAQIDSVNAAYFPTLLAGGNLAFSFFNNSQVTPFSQADPSGVFSLTGLVNGGTANNIGGLNGVSGPNFQFQADANQSFSVARVPEPGSLALVGLALGVLGFASRRTTKKA